MTVAVLVPSSSNEECTAAVRKLLDASSGKPLQAAVVEVSKLLENKALEEGILVALVAAGTAITRRLCDIAASSGEEDGEEEAEDEESATRGAGENAQCKAAVLLELLASRANGSLARSMQEIHFVISPCAAARSLAPRESLCAGGGGGEGCADSDEQGREESMDLEVRFRVPDRRSLILQKESPIPVQVWPCSRLLGEVLVSAPNIARGRSVLELGCGCHGIVASAAARAGATRIVATDASLQAVELMAANTAHNEGNSVVKTVMNWERPEDCSEIGPSEEFQLVLGADIIHEADHAALVVAMLRRFLAPAGLAMIANCNEHSRFGVESFKAALREEPEFDVDICTVPSEMVDRLSGFDNHGDGIVYDFYRVRRTGFGS